MSIFPENGVDSFTNFISFNFYNEISVRKVIELDSGCCL